MTNLTGKTVLITGSSRGIGRETALKFAEENCNVIITYYKDEKEAVDAAKKCRELGSEVLVVRLDLTDNKSIKDCVAKAVQSFKKIDFLINNAGAIAWKPLKEQSFEEIEMQARTNLEGLIKITKECLPHVKEMIINIASGAGKSAYSGLTAYCATKFGVRGFTQGLAQETSVKVCSVNPGMTATRMTDFRGTKPERVADVVLKVAKGQIRPDSNLDVDAWGYI